MNDLSRLKELTSQMHLEPSEDTDCQRLSRNKEDSIYIGRAIQSNGTPIKLLKTLLTSVCERNCNYCPFRTSRDYRRVTFSPFEFAKLFSDLYRSRIVDGIFLSSGIINGGIHSQDKLIDTAEILRNKFHFPGYIHLKIMPGAEKDQIEQAMRLANRVSINLEAPNNDRLQRLTSHKTFEGELLQPLKWIHEIRQTKPGHLAWNGHWPSSTTQFVVGAVDDTDLELLTTSQYLYQQLNLKRAYFSAFTPIIDTPFENSPATSPLRERRLYEASFLLRDYGFLVEELFYDSNANLPLNIDPKSLWAQKYIIEPIEINQADKMELLRIPGIGIKGAAQIISTRRINPIRELSDLRSLGINPKRTAPYILINGKHPIRQLAFSF